ncbi:MAG: flagellar biosynthesis protein FlhB [Planctomycetaceae bacterium]|nr:flagellar biosynthesis protein FlhB [Planctomycetaceae bacterium]
MPEQFGEKQHEATPYRRQQAREEGQVAKSQDLVSAVLLVAAVCLLMFWGGGVAEYLGRLAQRKLGGDPWLQADAANFVAESQAVFLDLARLLLPILGLLVLVAFVVNVGQVGFLFVPKKLAFDFSKLSPLRGFQRLFSISSAARLGFGIFKLVIVTAVAIWAVWAEQAQILSLSDMEISQIASFLISITLWTCLKIGIALLLLAILEYAFQRWKQEQDLRMTTQEVREEMKTLQGDPQVIARRKAVQRQLALNRMSSAVPKADVVVTNPTELAIAIQYDHETMDAPLVLAKGAGVVAQRIRRLALENNIPVVERKSLAQALYKQVEPSKPIPAEQYAAMAEVLRYVYELKGKTLPASDGQAAA